MSARHEYTAPPMESTAAWEQHYAMCDEIDRLRLRLFEDVTAARAELLTEIVALRAELRRTQRREMTA